MKFDEELNELEKESKELKIEGREVRKELKILFNL